MTTQKQPLIIAIIITLIFGIVTVTGFFVVAVLPAQATGADEHYPEVPAPAHIMAPQKVVGLVYNGRPQTLITAGQDDITYSLDRTNFTRTLPTAVNAGVYYVYYRVAGDDMIYSLYNTIAKKARPVTVSMAPWRYDQPASDPVVTVPADDGTAPVFTYYQNGQKLPRKPTAVGQYTVQVTVPAGANYQAGTATQDFAITSHIDLSFSAALVQAGYQNVTLTLGTQTQTLDLTVYSRTTLVNALSGAQTLTVAAADGTIIFQSVIKAAENQHIIIKGV